MTPVLVFALAMAVVLLLVAAFCVATSDRLL